MLFTSFYCEHAIIVFMLFLFSQRLTYPGCILHHASQMTRQNTPCLQRYHILRHAWLENTVGDRGIAEEDGRLAILFTSENSLIPSFLCELYSVYFNIYFRRKRLKRKSICTDLLSKFIQQHYFSSEGK